MSPDAVVDFIERLFAERSAEEYHGEAVSQQEHALQAAAAAEKAGAAPELIVAALLHDIGHLLQPHGDHAADRGIDDRHEALGQRFLEKHFGPAVVDPVRLHVAAKRYLCAVEPAYRAILSPASRQSLELQGGPMTATEIAEYESSPHHEAVTRLRRWDDIAKVSGLETARIEHYRESIRRSLK